MNHSVADLEVIGCCTVFCSDNYIILISPLYNVGKQVIVTLLALRFQNKEKQSL